jgi:ribosomal protein S18 acetylase RimI-like enzyme
MADLSIRDARPDDLEVVVDFNARLALETEGKELDAGVLRRGVAIALDDPDRLRYWVAEDEAGSVVGQAAITREWSDWRAGWIWWFQSVYVHPNLRNRGAFRALYARVRAIARSTPEVIGLRLYVEINNDRAKGVYQSLGMKPGGYDVYEDMWIGEKTESSTV